MTLGQMKREWKADTGPDRYRRGLYTFFWRATPYPFLTTFDAPAAQQTCTRRLRSNTPLQALTLLNDPAMVEIARRWPARIVRGAAADGRPIETGSSYAFILCLGASPPDRSWPRSSDCSSRRTSRTPRSRRQRSAPPVHGWSAVARVLLNLDEFVTRE